MKSFSQIQNLSEEEYDRMRDRRLEQGTWRSAGSNKPRSGGTQPKMKGKTPLQKDADKKYGAGTSAIDRVKADIAAKYGKGAIMDTKKKNEEIDLTEKIGGAGTLIRQGVKVGGKKGGQAVQKGTTAATAVGKEKAAQAAKGKPGAGKGEQRGAAIGGTVGAVAGALIPDGPAMVAGEIGGGIVGSKIGGKIGRQFDKKKQTVKEFVGTAVAGAHGAITAKKGDKVRKAVGQGAGHAVGSKVGEKVGGAVGSAVGSAAVPVVGGAIGKAVGSTVGGVAGGVTGAHVGGKIGKPKEKKNEEVQLEAKVDSGSPEKKEADRNLRKFGVKGNEMAHGKLRRSLHRMNRGDKKIKGDKRQYVETEGYAPGDVDQKVGAVTAIPKKEQDAAKSRLLAKAKAKRAKLKEDMWDQVDIFAEMNDWEISLLSDTLIEDIITDVFIEELQEGRDIDSVTDMLCESVDYSLTLITEVSDSYYDKAVAASKAASRTPEVKAANRREKLKKVKGAAKKVGSALKSGLKTGAKLARKGAVKGAEVAGKAAGHAKNLAKDMGSAAKSGYKSTQSSSPDKDSETTSSNPTTSDSDSSSSRESKPKKPGLLSRIGSKLKRGIKKAVGSGARSLSRGARNVARRLGEETITERGDFWHPDPDEDRKLGGPGANQRAREDRAAASKPAAKKADPKKLKKGESYMDYAKRQKGYTPPKKKEGLRDKIKRKLGLKREEVTVMSFGAFLSEGNRTGRMMHKSNTQVTGHISADRGSDEKKNREGRKGLEKDLKKHGIGHKKGVGEYKYDSGETGREVSYQTSKPDKMSKRRFGKVMRRMGRKHGQESVITKDKDKPAKLHYTEKGSKAKSDSIGKTKAGKHPEGYGETSGTKARGGKLPKKTTKGAYHYG